MPLPWQNFKSWEPFRLDALGLVTLLGADEVARAIGTLSPNTLTDFMPLLGAYRIAGNHFTANEPGYTMYNLTDGLTNTELSAWFTRWLSQFVNEWVAMDLEVVEPERNLFDSRMMASFLLGTTAHFFMIAFAVVQADWYGVANATGLLLATWVRNYLIYANLSEYDAKLSGLLDKPKERKKVLIVRPDGSLVVMHVELRLLLSLFGKLDPSATRFFSLGWHGMYTIARGIGWLAFGVHIVSIGQATLPSQLLAVAVMAFATIFTIFNVGTQQVPNFVSELRSPNHHEAQKPGYQTYKMGRRIAIKVQALRESKYKHLGNAREAEASKPIGTPTRRQMYWLLAPSKKEQTWMREWGLIALTPNDTWYKSWYDFLRDWTDVQNAAESDDPWNKLVDFLKPLRRGDLYTGDEAKVKSEPASTGQENTSNLQIDHGHHALPGASNDDSEPPRDTSGT